MKKAWKWSALAVLTIIAYLVGSMVLPPAFIAPTPAFTPAKMATGERVACIDDNTDALIWRLRMIESAEETVTLCTFGFSNGQSGRDVLAALHAAAERGVQIRLLLDGYHGTKVLNNEPMFQTLADREQVQIRVYNPINVLTPWTANYRMHDKYLMVDDEMYLLGGRNTNDLFLGDYSDHPNLDRDILVCDTGVDGSLGQLKDYFGSVWELCEEFEGKKDQGAEAALKNRYAQLKEIYPQAFGFTDYHGQTVPANGVAVLTNGAKIGNKEPKLWSSLCGYMAQGQRTLIQTPYVICNDLMYADLRKITGQGKSVTILTNSPETGANPFGSVDYRNEKRNILAAGVDVLEYAGKESMHTKTVLIDDNLSIVGSFNMDMRSTYLDTETMLIIDCPELNASLRGQVESMADESLHVKAGGESKPGIRYEKGKLGFWKSVGYTLLGLVEGLFRHIL